MHRHSRLAMLVVAGTMLAGTTVAAQDESPCSRPEAAEFDFWLGVWDLTWEGGHGTNVITPIVDGCGIQESFTGSMRDGSTFRGLSVSTFSRESESWRQTWVDNSAGYLEFTGGMTDDGRMILARTAEKDGETVHQRMVFYNIEPESLDWNWERSDDGGQSWQLLWKIHYERRR